MPGPTVGHLLQDRDVVDELERSEAAMQARLLCHVAKAPADGYTILMISNAVTINETLNPKRGYNLLRDFVPITQLSSLSLVLVVNPAFPAKTVGESLENVPAKFFKEADVWVKTKTPVLVLKTDNEIPKE